VLGLGWVLFFIWVGAEKWIKGLKNRIKWHALF
jgi:hypothetical protein